MMYALMLFDWFHCVDCVNERTRTILNRHAWTLTYDQWDWVCECGGLYEYEV